MLEICSPYQVPTVTKAPIEILQIFLKQKMQYTLSSSS